MDTKYTQGPWWVLRVIRRPGPEDDFFLLEGIDSETGNRIEIASLHWLLKSDEECRANADLIAAGPDLLNALEDAVKALNSGNGVKQLKAAEKARAVIAKAKEGR